MAKIILLIIVMVDEHKNKYKASFYYDLLCFIKFNFKLY
jgi:hypothetical protein